MRKKAAKPVRCPDCNSLMADGGAVGYYCVKPGCDHDTWKGALKDMRIDRIHLHDTPEDTPQFKEDLQFEQKLTDNLVVVQVVHPKGWAKDTMILTMAEIQRLLRLIDIYRIRAGAK